jgi:hypothetical protein
MVGQREYELCDVTRIGSIVPASLTLEAFSIAIYVE